MEQGKALNEELKKSAKDKMNRHVTVHVVNEFKDVYSAVDKMSKEELESLKERLNELTAKKEEAAEDMPQEAPQETVSSEDSKDGEEDSDDPAES